MSNSFAVGWPIIVNVLLALLALGGLLYILYLCSREAGRRVTRKPTLQLNEE